ncbi:oligosaccharide translocation protein RFT1 [Phyllosticta citribraziliensis]|uniref:Man(5)GlcNAc(2)-PP-dolichol translocation protein RFT1 n=1 Tax=Phyllosticta citribraziliensis TaxID=989973 RepID=A0ABR1LDB3_9PEZI
MSSVLSASAKGATFLILLQVGSRFLTFAVNQVLLRYLSPELLGVSAQLELFNISVVYFSRESLRVALQRQATGIQTVINLSYLAIFLGTPLAHVLAWTWLRAQVPDVAFFRQSLWIYAYATIIELFTEPAFTSTQQLLLYKVRASAESAGTILRCFATCAFAIWASRTGCDPGASPFAVGQLAYAVALLATYLIKVIPVSKREKFSLLPKFPEKSKSDEIPLLKLSLSLFMQSSVKYILTQGDAILIASWASLRDQGAYALASNYGGLIARMLFQPIEEASRNLFSKLCAVQASTQKPAKEGLKQAKQTLETILHLYNLISLAACGLGPTLAPLLLKIVAGSKWAETGAGETLATYCYYIPLLALNGVTEAFIASVATNAELGAQSFYMGFFFAGFAGSAYLFLQVLQMGAQGLVFANCVNMALRIVWGLSFIKKYFGRHGKDFDFLATLPKGLSIAAAVSASPLLKMTNGLFPRYGVLGDLVPAGGVAAVFGLGLLFLERDYLVQCYHMLRPKREAQPDKEGK